VVAKASGQTTWLDAVVDSKEIDILSAVLIDVDEAHVIIGTKEGAEALADWAVEMLDVFLADGFPLAARAGDQGRHHLRAAAERVPYPAGGAPGPVPPCAGVRARHAATLAAWQRVADDEVDGFLAA
jgi:hypothetical protein